MVITKEKPRNVKETNYINFIDFTSHPIGGIVNEWDDCEYCDMVNVTAMSYIKRVKLCQNLITNVVKIYYDDNSTEIFAMTNGFLLHSNWQWFPFPFPFPVLPFPLDVVNNTISIGNHYQHPLHHTLCAEI